MDMVLSATLVLNHNERLPMFVIGVSSANDVDVIVTLGLNVTD